MITLKPMNIDEFTVFEMTSKKNYIADKMRANGLSLEDATNIATSDFARYLPDGFISKNNFLFMIKDGDKSVGHLWYVTRGVSPVKAYIADILLYEESRGKGIGRAAMNLLEENVRSQGISFIGLHVFGFNEAAISLYKSLGYLATDIMMEKKLD